MKKCVNGKVVDLTSDEISAIETERHKLELTEKSRPLTETDITRLFIGANINTIITDNETASRAVDFHPSMEYNGNLIAHGTRINWHGQLKKAAVDLWDTEANNPDNAPALWEDISYKNGFRIIPKTITATLAFSKDECGWWGDTLFRSLIAANVYTPAVYPQGWEIVEM